MATPSLQFLKRGKLVSDHIYKDIQLDLEKNYTQGLQLRKIREIKDLRPDYDLEAIKNSLFNLFTTLPGQKILNPPYGLNLMQYVFTNLTENNARLMAQTILQGVKIFEPRVSILNISVIVNFDESQYDINLRISVPSLNLESVSLKGVLKDSGYYFI